MAKKITEIESFILDLLHENSEVSVRNIIEARNTPKDDKTARRAINRTIVSLQKKNLIVSKGAGRSRVYILPEQPQRISINDIALSSDSRSLLKYIAQPVTARTPIGYDQDFLRGYKPNATFYLSAEQRKKLHVIGRVESVVRPAGTYARNILNRLLIDLSWNSSRLEGNTYSLLETQRLIELGESASGKDLIETQMILNHKAAIEYIVESAEDKEITPHEVKSIHALLSDGLLGDPSASGRLRSIAVNIGGSVYVPLENPPLIQDMFDLFIEKLNLIDDAFEQSLFAIVHLSYLQAFEDVNKRTGRLVANIPLVKKNLKPLSFTDVEQSAYVSAILGVYEKKDVSLLRDLYVWAYNRSAHRYSAVQQSLGEPDPLKLRYRSVIQEIVRTIILEKITGSDVVSKIRELLEANHIPEADRAALFTLIETEFLYLHDGNIARFKVLPSEFEAWKILQ